MTSSKPVRLLTPDEAAQFLSVSQRTVKRLVAEGSLRVHQCNQHQSTGVRTTRV